MEYLFVFSDGGWWLKLDSIEKLIDYHQKMNGSYFEDAFLMYMHKGSPDKILESLSLPERIEMMNTRSFKHLQGAVMQAQNGNGTIMDGFRWMNMEIGMVRLRYIREYGAVYINRVGGHTFSLNYTQFCRRKELVFPDFKKEDIRIKRFHGGCHYYAYIGDMQLHNGEQSKWNTHDAAYEAALKYIS